MGERVLISEVGPRDGLQNAKATMATVDKHRWIRALAAAGLREIEVGSFVPATVLPQMADVEEVVGQASAIDGLVVAALVPNLKGGERALRTGCHKVTVPVSVSRSHALANVRMSPDEAVAQVAALCRRRDELAPDARPLIEGGLSTVFGCTIEGPVAEDEVVRLALALADAGVDEIGLADTTGMADPAQVRRVVRKVRAAVGERLDGVHLHNTNGFGLANALAAFEEGIRTFDASLAGLGGCPWAPGATGNIVTEDLVNLFERLGIATGVDLGALMGARTILAQALPDEPLYGHYANLHAKGPSS